MTSYLDIARQALSQGAGITNTKKAKDTKKPSRANSLISSNSCSYYSSGSTQRPIASDADAAWRAEDWQAIFEEHAAIIDFDAKLSRGQAKARALAWCVADWLIHYPVRSAPGRCLGCGAGDRPFDPLLPFGTKAAGYVGLHADCWPAWHAGGRPRPLRS
jgi:hypothetical protein